MPFVTSQPVKQQLSLKLIFTKICFQNLAIGFIIGVLVKQVFSLYQFPLFNVLEASLIFSFILGIFYSGFLSEHWGRKPLVTISWVILSIALAFLSFSQMIILIWAELAFSFFAIGFFVTVFPIYIAECAPAVKRGGWVLASFFCILLGISIFSFIDFNFQFNQVLWYLAANALAVMALAINHYQFESPAWLIEQARFEEARDILARLRSADVVDKEIAVSKSSIRRRPRSWQQIYERQLATKLRVGRFLALFRQLTGIGVMLLYLPYLFMQRWSVDPGVLWILIFISLSTGLLFAVIYVDSVGRRKLTTISFFAQAVILISLALSWKLNVQHEGMHETIHELILVLSFLFFFTLGAGPITWLAWVELMPLRSRARYVGRFLIVSLILGILIWFCYYFLIHLIGIREFYLTLAVLAFFAAVYCWQKMPETKKYLLDEI